MSDKEFVESGLLAAIKTASGLEKQVAELERELTVANNWVEHHQNHCDDLIKENARLRMELDASCNAEELRQVRDENAALRAELEAEAVVNGKGGEREAKLLAEVAKLQGCVDRLGAANDLLLAEKKALRNEVACLNNQTMWVCSCGGTDCAGQKENAALRADKERLDWIIGEAHYLFFKELASDLAKGRQQIDAARKEAQP